MRRCSGLALGALLAACMAPAVQAQKAELVGSYLWQDEAAEFGGLSGFDLTADGLGFVVVSDRSLLMTGQVLRDGAGRVTEARIDRRIPLKAEAGRRKGGRAGDSEGISLGPKGGLFVSFEGPARVERADGVGGKLQPLASPREFKPLPGNEGLEAMAVDDAGTVFTVPERATLRGGGFAIFRLKGGVWGRPFVLAARGGYVPVGADMGPDGKLYVLERDFLGIRGFAARVVRMDVAGDGGEEEVLVTAPGLHDNLEGIAVWRDGAGAVRLTMVSDDNFSILQQTQIVDYQLSE